MKHEVELLGDRYELIAGLLGATPDELRRRDSARSTQRWVALDEGEPVATAWAWQRPDDRMFLSVAGSELAFLPLIQSAGRAIEPLHAHVPATETDRLQALLAAGFEVEVETEQFRCRFDTALEWLARVGRPHRYRLVDVSETDPRRLFELDNVVRQDVPGTDGWRGNWDMFLDELDDPASYHVAISSDGAYAGLCRIWHNEQPSFGLLAVRREHRGGLLAAGLLRSALEEAAGWGHDHFFTGTSTANQVTHPRLVRLADARLGLAYQMVRTTTA